MVCGDSSLRRASYVSNTKYLFMLALAVASAAVFCVVTIDSDDSSATAGVEFTVGDYNYTITSDAPATVEIDGPVSKTITSIVIPETVTYSAATYTVTSIKANAFSNCTSATSITIPHTVTSIGSSAFAICRHVTQLNYDVPENTNTSAQYMFAEIGSEGTGVTVAFGEHVRKVPPSMFVHQQTMSSKSNRVSTVTFEDGLTHIGASAFSNCGLLAEITIPANVVEIGANAFYNANNLQTVYVNAVHLNDYTGTSGVFSYNGLAGHKTLQIIFGEGVEHVPAYFATGSYNKVREVVISSTVKTIGTAAFNGNQTLTSVTMYGAPQIQGACFSCGTAMSSKTISVTSICESGFLDNYGNQYTHFNYTQLPHVALNMSGHTPVPVPDNWYYRNGSLLRYYAEGDSISIPTIHVTGYTFTGWNTTPATVMGTSTLLYTSSWNINHVTITFNSNGGTSVEPISANYGTPISFVAPTRTGYWLTGWSPAIPATMPESDTEYTAQWVLQEHTVYYDSQGGEAVDDAVLHYGETIPQPSITRTGYDFQGWTLSPTGSTMGEQDVNATANWQIRSVTVSFVTGEGTPINPITADYGTPLSVSNPTRTGYNFTGWSPTLPSTMPEHNQSYTAQWQIQSHSVTYYSNGGTNVPSASLEYGQTIPQPQITRPGYNFIGWTLSPAGTTMGETNVTATATWEAKTVTIFFNTNGGTSISPISGKVDSIVSAPVTTKTGYNFTGWTPYFNNKMPTSDTTYSANWSLQYHTVTYETNGGTKVSSVSVGYNQPIPLPSKDPTRTGYKFVQWSIAPGTLMGTENITVTAEWSGNYYRIMYYNEYNLPTFLQSYQCGQPISDIMKPKLDGYKFYGWAEDVTTMPANDLYLTPIWIPEEKKDNTVIYAAGAAIGVIALLGAAALFMRLKH